MAAETEAGMVRFRRRQRYLRRARTFDKLKVLLDEIETEWADSQQNQPAEGFDEDAADISAMITFVFYSQSGTATKSPDFSKASAGFRACFLSR